MDFPADHQVMINEDNSLITLDPKAQNFAENWVKNQCFEDLKNCFSEEIDGEYSKV